MLIKPGLLLQAVHAWWSGGLLLQRQMHALVPAILLRVSWLDAFDGDAEAQPPDGQLGEIEQCVGAGERDAVVGSDSLREAALLEERLERSDGEVFAGRFERLTRQKVARGTVGDGQRVAVTPVAQLELAVEVGAPKPIVQSSRRQDASIVHCRPLIRATVAFVILYL